MHISCLTTCAYSLHIFICQALRKCLCDKEAKASAKRQKHEAGEERSLMILFVLASNLLILTNLLEPDHALFGFYVPDLPWNMWKTIPGGIGDQLTALSFFYYYKTNDCPLVQVHV